MKRKGGLNFKDLGGRNNGSRRSPGKKCSAIETALCCSEYAINNHQPPGLWCQELGCDTNKQVCGDGRDARRQEKSRPDGKTNNRDNRNDKKSGPDAKRNNRNNEKGEGDHDDRRFLTSTPPLTRKGNAQ